MYRKISLEKRKIVLPKRMLTALITTILSKSISGLKKE